MTEQTLKMSDIQLMLNIFVGKVTPTSDQIIACNLNGDDAITMSDIQIALNTLVGKVDASVILRDEAASDATYNANTTVITNGSNAFDIQAGNAMNLEAFYLGDIDGNYAAQIVA